MLATPALFHLCRSTPVSCRTLSALITRGVSTLANRGPTPALSSFRPAGSSFASARKSTSDTCLWESLRTSTYTYTRRPLVQAMGSNNPASSSFPSQDMKDMSTVAAKRENASTEECSPMKKAKVATTVTKEVELAQFNAVYADLRAYCISLLPTYDMPASSIDYVTKLIDHNVQGGKLNRGLTTVAVARSLLGSRLTAETLLQAQVLGWGVEWLQACFLVADDLMDASITRRGQPCWYKLPGVGLNAINDYTLLQSMMYKVLKLHFGTHPRYVEIFEMFNEVRLQTEIGQLYDLTTSPNVGKVDLNNFTMDNYRRIVRFKTAYYTFYLPMALGMVVAGITDEKSFGTARLFCLEVGEYFQIQDDVLDCFGDPKVIGKIGTDIEDNKCCWMVVQALARATPDQKTIITENYGRHDPACVAKIKDLYRELKLQEVFAAYEEESYTRLTAMIDTVNSSIMPREVFTETLAKIYKRAY